MSFSEQTNSEPGAVATGSWTQRKTPSGVGSVERRSPAECSTRSLPLPVLYLSTHRVNTVSPPGVTPHATAAFCESITP
jgi:hypothetical protein